MNIKKLLDDAINANDRSDFKEAKKIYQKILELDPKNEQYWIDYISIFVKLNSILFKHNVLGLYYDYIVVRRIIKFLAYLTVTIKPYEGRFL